MFLKEAERPAGEPAKVGTLKLSEAIRIGAKLRPIQCRRVFFREGSSCAMGAAYEAITGKVLPYGSVDGKAMKGVVPHYNDFEIRFQIAERNDRGESREQIADWLESQGY